MIGPLVWPITMGCFSLRFPIQSSDEITLLRVIPTMTFIHFVTGKPSGILSDIPSGILSGISSAILSDISSDILSRILSGILSGTSSDILSDIFSGHSSR